MQTQTPQGVDGSQKMLGFRTVTFSRRWRQWTNVFCFQSTTSVRYKISVRSDYSGSTPLTGRLS